MATNRYGLDASYLQQKLELLLRDADNYTPDEMARALARLAVVADSTVLCEAEFAKHAARPAPTSGGWIQASERLPALGQKVDICCNGVVQEEVYWLDQGDDGFGTGEHFWDCNNPDLDERPAVNFERDMWRERPKAPTGIVRPAEVKP